MAKAGKSGRLVRGSMTHEGNRDLVIDFKFRYAKFKVCMGYPNEMYSMREGIWVWISGCWQASTYR